jgi:thiol-disulfide isomerase/thioredoxin
MDITGSGHKEDAKKVMKEMPIIIFFHADWCGHCQRTMPHWKSLVSKKSDYGLGDIKMISIESEAIPDDAGVTSFPHFRKVDKKGKATDIMGEKRSVEELAKALGLKVKSGGRLLRRTRRNHSRRLRRRVRKTLR